MVEDLLKTISSNSIKLLLLILISLFVLSVAFLHPVYASLTVAFILAYLLDPLVGSLTRCKIPREWGALLVLFIFFLLLIGVVILIIPKLLSQGEEFFLRLPKVYMKLTTLLAPYSQQYLSYNVFEDAQKLLETFGSPTTVLKPLGKIAQSFFSTTFKFIMTLLGFLVVPLLAYYLLRVFPQLYERLLSVIPKRYHKTTKDIRKRLNIVFGGFIRGQLVVSSILSIYYSIALTFVGLDLSLLLGLMAGFFNVVPYLGILSALLLTLFIALVHEASAGVHVAILAIFGVGMALEGSILTPKIVGSKVGLGPLTLLLSLLVGGQLLGVVGMLLAIPLAAVGKVFLDVWLDAYRNSELYTQDGS